MNARRQWGLGVAAVAVTVVTACAPTQISVGGAQADAVSQAAPTDIYVYEANTGAVGDALPNSIRTLALSNGETVKTLLSDQAKDTVGQYVTKLLGETAGSAIGGAAGAIVGTAIGALLGGLFGDTSQEDVVLSALNKLYNQMNTRFDQVDQEIQDLSNQMQASTKQILDAQDQSTLYAAQSNVDTLVRHVRDALDDRDRVTEFLAMQGPLTADQTKQLVASVTDLQNSQKLVLEDLDDWEGLVLGTTAGSVNVRPGLIPQYQKVVANSGRFLTATDYDAMQRQASYLASWVVLANQVASEFAIGQQQAIGTHSDMRLVQQFITPDSSGDSAFSRIQKAVPNAKWAGTTNAGYVVDSQTGLAVVNVAGISAAPIPAGTYTTPNGTYQVDQDGIDGLIKTALPNPASQPDDSWAKTTTYVKSSDPNYQVLSGWNTGQPVYKWIAANTNLPTATALKLPSLSNDGAADTNPNTVIVGPASAVTKPSVDGQPPGHIDTPPLPRDSWLESWFEVPSGTQLMQRLQYLQADGKSTTYTTFATYFSNFGFRTDIQNSSRDDCSWLGYFGWLQYYQDHLDIQYCKPAWRAGYTDLYRIRNGTVVGVSTSVPKLGLVGIPSLAQQPN